MSRALEKGLTLLSLVAEGRDSLPGLVAASGLPKSTVHRLAAVLVDRELLRYQDNRYILGYRLLELSEKAKRGIDYLAVARPHLESMAEETSEAVHLGELTGSHIVYLEKVEGERSLQMKSRVGLRVPAQATALGKVLISCRPRAEWESHLLDDSPATEATPIRKTPLFQELAAVRDQGYAFDREEHEPGIRCVAAPLWDATGRVVAAISISGAAIFLTEQRQQELLPVLLGCTRTISRELGGGAAPAAHEADVARGSAGVEARSGVSNTEGEA